MMCNCTSGNPTIHATCRPMDSGFDASHRPGMTPATLLPRPAPAEQENALLTEHIPDPPRQGQRHRAAVEIERDRTLHLDVDLVAELHEILDGAEMDVRRVVPGRRQIFG